MTCQQRQAEPMTELQGHHPPQGEGSRLLSEAGPQVTFLLASLVVCPLPRCGYLRLPGAFRLQDHV